MHEVGIACAILEAAQAEAIRHNGARVLRVGVRIGTLSGVDLDALRFALSAMTMETELAEVRFELESCSRRNRCAGCAHEFETGTMALPCPRCHSLRSMLVGGEELDVAFIELEDA